MNLYAANPFGGLQAPIAVSSGESDQTYNVGARTEYGGLQNTQAARQSDQQAEANHGDKPKNFIAVKDNAHEQLMDNNPGKSPIVSTNIGKLGGGARQINTSDKNAPHGRTS